MFSSQITRCKIKSALLVGQRLMGQSAVASVRSASAVRTLSSVAKGEPITTTTTTTTTTTVPPTPPTLTLYQYSICPFCNINKALLSYTDTPYHITEVNPLTKAELKFSSEYKKVPILQIMDNVDDDDDDDNVQINGSKEINNALLKHPFIMQQLKAKWNNHNGDDPDPNADAEQQHPIQSFANTDNARRWNNFAIDELAPVLYPNICRSLSESYEAFGYVKNIKEFSTLQKGLIRGVGSLAMYVAASKIKQRRNITDEREALLNILQKWEEEGLDCGNQLFGSGLDRPDLGDVAMFGVMHSVSGLKAHDDVIMNGGAGGGGGVVVDWYERMKKEVL